MCANWWGGNDLGVHLLIGMCWCAPKFVNIRGQCAPWEKKMLIEPWLFYYRPATCNHNPPPPQLKRCNEAHFRHLPVECLSIHFLMRGSVLKSPDLMCGTRFLGSVWGLLSVWYWVCLVTVLSVWYWVCLGSVWWLFYKRVLLQFCLNLRETVRRKKKASTFIFWNQSYSTGC